MMSCWTSEEYLRDKQDYARKNNWGFIPTTKQYDAECPYCGVDLAFEYDYEGACETEDECPACGKTFDLHIEFEPMYYPERRKDTDAD